MEIIFNFKDSRLFAKTDWTFCEMPKTGDCIKLNRFIANDKSKLVIRTKKENGFDEICLGNFKDLEDVEALERPYGPGKYDTEFKIIKRITYPKIVNGRRVDKTEDIYVITDKLPYDINSDGSPICAYSVVLEEEVK